MWLLPKNFRMKYLLAFVLCLLAVSCFYDSLVSAQDIQPQIITINSDGSITPDTNMVQKTGNTYFLTGDLTASSVTIDCSNIVFDGKGYTIDGRYGDRGYGYTHVGLLLGGVSGVVVQDVIVKSFWGDQIQLDYCSDCTLLRVQTQDGQQATISSSNNIQISKSKLNCLVITEDSNNNVIEKNLIETLELSGSSNIVTENNVTQRFFPEFATNNFIYKNNFYALHPIKNMDSNSWDNEGVGNFWWNYLWNKPSGSVNTTVVDGLTVGDVPYTIDSNNVDHHPLIYPYIAVDTPKPSQGTIQSLAIILGAAIVASVLSAAVILVLYRKGTHRKKPT
jgi:hypothetical protein